MPRGSGELDFCSTAENGGDGQWRESMEGVESGNRYSDTVGSIQRCVAIDIG